MAKNEKPVRGPRAKGKKVGGTAAKWLDGEDVQGVLVSAIRTKTRHGERALIAIERPDNGDTEERYMPQSWADRLSPLVGQRIAIARDGEGFEARYDVRVLD